MKRIRKAKSKWLKRIDLKDKKYWYQKKDNPNDVIERFRNRTDIRFEYAEWYIVFGKNIKHFFNNWEMWEKIMKVSGWIILIGGTTAGILLHYKII